MTPSRDGDSWNSSTGRPWLHAGGVLHAVEHPSSGALEFLALATRELVCGGIGQTVVFARRDERSVPKALLALFDARVRLVAIDGRAGRWHWAFGRALRHELAVRPYDAVHLHNGCLAGRLAIGSLPAHPPVFYTPHQLRRSHHRRALLRVLADWVERLAVPRVCHPVGCDHGDARELERLTRRDASVLEHAVDSVFFEVEPRPEQPPRVLTLGDRGDARGAHRFAELAARFHFAEEPVQFVWAGQGEPALEQPLVAAGVEVLGPLAPAAWREQLARAQVFVHLSRGRPSEPHDRAIRQAMAAALPCVVAGTPGAHDLVAHEITGLIAGDVSGLAQHVKRLLDEPERARELGAAARREARQRFHPQGFRRALLALYRLDGARRPAARPAAVEREPT